MWRKVERDIKLDVGRMVGMPLEVCRGLSQKGRVQHLLDPTLLCDQREYELTGRPLRQ